jgi:hypothetical protein
MQGKLPSTIHVRAENYINYVSQFPHLGFCASWIPIWLQYNACLFYIIEPLSGISPDPAYRHMLVLSGFLFQTDWPWRISTSVRAFIHAAFEWSPAVRLSRRYDAFELAFFSTTRETRRKTHTWWDMITTATLCMLDFLLIIYYYHLQQNASQLKWIEKTKIVCNWSSLLVPRNAFAIDRCWNECSEIQLFHMARMHFIDRI